MVGIIKETGQVHRNSGIFISKKMIAEISFILVIAVIALVAIEAFQSPTTSTGLQQKDAQQAEQATYTGVANPSQNAVYGQETTQWYSLSESRDTIHLNKYDMNLRFGFENPATGIEWTNPNHKYAYSDDIFIQLRYRNKQTQELIKEDTIKHFTFANNFIDFNWRKVLGYKTDPKNIEWQMDFSIKKSS